MIKTLLIVSTLILISADGVAQRQRMRPAVQQVESEKIAFFTRYLDLTGEEAAAFWPVYNDYQDRRTTLVRERQALSAEFTRNQNTITGREATDMADKYIDLHLQEAMLSKEFHDNLKEILAPEKIMLFYQAESEFRMQLLNRIRGGGGGRGPGLP